MDGPLPHSLRPPLFLLLLALVSCSSASVWAVQNGPDAGIAGSSSRLLSAKEGTAEHALFFSSSSIHSNPTLSLRRFARGDTSPHRSSRGMSDQRTPPSSGYGDNTMTTKEEEERQFSTACVPYAGSPATGGKCDYVISSNANVFI